MSTTEIISELPKLRAKAARKASAIGWSGKPLSWGVSKALTHPSLGYSLTKRRIATRSPQYLRMRMLRSFFFVSESFGCLRRDAPTTWKRFARLKSPRCSKGKPTRDSDVDVLVIMPFNRKRGRKSLEIRQRIPADFPLDLIVRTPEFVARGVRWGDCFMQEILAKGEVLYEATDPGVGGKS